ncbi:MAG: hypothetical protein AB7P20_14685 [Rhizobiaceae bacterium]
MLAYGIIVDPGGDIGDLIASLGIQPIGAQASGFVVFMTVLLAGNIVFAAILFSWAFIAGSVSKSSAESDQADISRMACCAAASTVTLLLITSIARGEPIPFLALSVQLAALGASYLAFVAERLLASLTASKENEARSAARSMALGAAHGAILSRLIPGGLSTPDGAR